MRLSTAILGRIGIAGATLLLSAGLCAQERSPNEQAALARLDDMVRLNARYQVNADEHFELTKSSLNRRTLVESRQDEMTGKRSVYAMRGGGGATLSVGVSQLGVLLDGGSFYCMVAQRTEPLTEEELGTILSDEETDQLLMEMFRTATNDYWSYTIVKKQDYPNGLRRYELKYHFLGFPTDTLDSTRAVLVDRYIGIIAEWQGIPRGIPSELTSTGRRLSSEYLRQVAIDVYASMEPFPSARLVHARLQMGVPDATRANYRAMTQYHHDCVAANELTLMFVLTVAHSSRDLLRQTIAIDAFTGQPAGLSRYDYGEGARGVGLSKAVLASVPSVGQFTTELGLEMVPGEMYGRLDQTGAQEPLATGVQVVLRDKSGTLWTFQYDAATNVIWREEDGALRHWRPDARLALSLTELARTADHRRALLPESFRGAGAVKPGGSVRQSSLLMLLR